ncbi:MAG TPA: sulfotransferase [Actinomycetota bacterium]|nr:sulfotransferase [Actinomycetota bacterium]
MTSSPERLRRVSGPEGEERSPVRYVCMPGSPYTGSTLLGFLLDAHPACASIGAATGLTARIDLETYRCSCGERFVECPFWRRVAARAEELGTPVTVFRTGYWNTHVRLSRRRWLNGVLIRSLGNATLNDVRDAVVGLAGPVRRRMTEARRSSWTLARAVLDATGASVFVDTARDHQRPRYLMDEPTLDLRVIHLVRDPRGNTASIVKHTGVDVATAARQWRHYNREADRVRERFPPEAWMRLHYEDLCADPQATLDRIAGFLGVEPAPLPPDLSALEHHVIGNSMRLKGVGEIREDEAWKTTLTEADLRVIARATRSVSHRLGYAWP